MSNWNRKLILRRENNIVFIREVKVQVQTLDAMEEPFYAINFSILKEWVEELLAGKNVDLHTTKFRLALITVHPQNYSGDENTVRLFEKEVNSFLKKVKEPLSRHIELGTMTTCIRPWGTWVEYPINLKVSANLKNDILNHLILPGDFSLLTGSFDL